MVVKTALVASVPQGSLRIRDVARIRLTGTIALVPELRVQGAVSQSLKRWLRSWRGEKKKDSQSTLWLPHHS